MPDPALVAAALIRVDDPDHPDAIVRSSTGSVLMAPPSEGTPWRHEPWPEVDTFAPGTEVTTVVGAEAWNDAGFTGAGVKIAIFDVGWDASASEEGEVAATATHDCANAPSCELAFDPLSPRYDIDRGAHGWACAEVIRDIAPDADIHLVRVTGHTVFENAIDWAIRDGVDLISMSMSFYNTSFYDGTGPFHAPILKLEANDGLLVSSAGNNARNHWSGPWRDGDADGRHDLGGGNGLTLALEAGTATIYLSWNQFLRCGDTDLALALTSGDVEIAYADTRQAPDEKGCEPVERLTADIPEDGVYTLSVHLIHGGTTDLAVDVLTRDKRLDAPRATSSTADPASIDLTYAVAAIGVTSWDEGTPESYSSWGPNHAGHQTPDIAGPDGLNASAYGSGGFFGTSASTPAVAGMLALILDRYPDSTPREAAEMLSAWAHPTTPGSPWDPATGAGRALLPDPSATGPCGASTSAAFLPLLGFAAGSRRRLRRARFTR